MKLRTIEIILLIILAIWLWYNNFDVVGSIGRIFAILYSLGLF